MTIQQAVRCVQDKRKMEVYMEDECPPLTTNQQPQWNDLSVFTGFLRRFCDGEVWGTAYDEFDSSIMMEVARSPSPLFTPDWDM